MKSKRILNSESDHIVLLVSNSIKNEEPEETAYGKITTAKEEMKEMNDLNLIDNESDEGYIIDIKQEAKKSSINDIHQMVTSELTGVSIN